METNKPPVRHQGLWMAVNQVEMALTKNTMALVAVEPQATKAEVETEALEVVKRKTGNQAAPVLVAVLAAAVAGLTIEKTAQAAAVPVELPTYLEKAQAGAAVRQDTSQETSAAQSTRGESNAAALAVMTAEVLAVIGAVTLMAAAVLVGVSMI